MASTSVVFLAVCLLAVFALSNELPNPKIKSSKTLQQTASQSNSYAKQSYATGSPYVPDYVTDEASDISDDSTDIDEDDVNYVPANGISQNHFEQEQQESDYMNVQNDINLLSYPGQDYIEQAQQQYSGFIGSIMGY